jgi:hypothetical protein
MFQDDNKENYTRYCRKLCLIGNPKVSMCHNYTFSYSLCDRNPVSNLLNEGGKNMWWKFTKFIQADVKTSSLE